MFAYLGLLYWVPIVLSELWRGYTVAFRLLIRQFDGMWPIRILEATKEEAIKGESL
jgi:hypothetical protein